MIWLFPIFNFDDLAFSHFEILELGAATPLVKMSYFLFVLCSPDVESSRTFKMISAPLDFDSIRRYFRNVESRHRIGGSEMNVGESIFFVFAFDIFISDSEKFKYV